MNSPPRNDADQVDLDGKALEPNPGRKVGPYQILSPLGVGGMGEVYLAEDPTLERRVALKFLSQVMEEDTTARERFLREARTAAALDHPFICKVYEIGEADGRPYISMEYLRGQTLQQRMEAGPLELDEALLIAIEVCEALAEAHSRGIVHRDLKPGNIMIEPRGHAKVLDFGLAKRVSSTQELVTQMEVLDGLTRPGATVGTLAYMSPEQLRGEKLDTRSDIFSFGILLQEMITGVHPFQQAHAMETASSILRDEPASAPFPVEGVEKILCKMLAKRPQDRYQSVDEVLEALNEIRPTPNPLPWYSLPLPLTAAALLLMALLVLVAQFSSPPVNKEFSSVAILPFTDAGSENDYLALGVSRAVTRRLLRMGLRVTPWETALRYEGSEQSPLSIAGELQVEAVLAGNFKETEERIRAEVYLIEARTGLNIWLESFETPYGDIFDLQYRIASGVASRMKEELSEEDELILSAPESDDPDAYEFYLQGSDSLRQVTEENTGFAQDYFQKALRVDPEMPEAHVGLGSIYLSRFAQGWDGSLENLRLAEVHFGRAIAADSKNLRARRGLMQVYYERGQTRKVLEQGRLAKDAGNPDEVETRVAVAWSYGFSGFAELAVAQAQQILAIDRQNASAYWLLSVFGSGRDKDTYLELFVDDRTARLSRGVQDLAAGYVEDALAKLKPGSEGLESSKKPSIADLQALLYKGIAYYRQALPGDEARALESWKRGARLLEQDLQQDPENIKKQILLACFYGVLERPEFASQRDLALKRTRAADCNVWTLITLAAVDLRMGRKQEGHALLREILERGRPLPLGKGTGEVGRPALSLISAMMGREPSLPLELIDRHARFRDQLIQEFGPE